MIRFWEFTSKDEPRESFRAKVAEIGSEYRRAHGITQSVFQLGLIVPDVERAATELEAIGAGPFFLAEGTADWWVEHGAEGLFRSRLGLGYLHGIELGLHEVGEGSTIYSDYADPEGQIVIHHFACAVPSIEPWEAQLRRAGERARVRGRLVQGPLRLDFVYVDAVEEAGALLELVTFTLFGAFNRRPPEQVYSGLGRLQQLSGRRVFTR